MACKHYFGGGYNWVSSSFSSFSRRSRRAWGLECGVRREKRQIVHSWGTVVGYRGLGGQ